MNNTNQTKPNQIRSGSKWAGLGITLLLAGFAVARITKRFSNRRPTVQKRHVFSGEQEQKNLFSIPESLFDECVADASRKSITFDFFAKPSQGLSDAWNFSVQKQDGSHATLNTGWGRRKKDITATTTANKALSAQGLMQSLPEGNLAYNTAGTHQAKQTSYPSFKNSPFSGSKGQRNTGSNQSQTNGGSYAGGRSSGDAAPTSKEGPNNGHTEQKNQNNRNLPQNQEQKARTPLQRATANLVEIIENKMLSIDKTGQTAYTDAETQQAFTVLKNLVQQNNNVRGSQQKERLKRLQAKLAVTDVVNSFLATIAHAPRPNSVSPALTRDESQKLITAKATNWENILTIANNLNVAPTDPKSVNPYPHVQDIYAKLNELLDLCGMNPKQHPTNDTFAEIRRLEKNDAPDYLKNKGLNEEEWIEYLGKQIADSFGTPWFNPTILHGITEQSQKKVADRFAEKKSSNATQAELEQLQQSITTTLETELTNPLFRETLGLDLKTYQSLFLTLTQSGNANKLQEIGQLIEQAGLTKTGAEQLNAITQSIMQSWVALSSAVDGQLGGFFKQAMWSVTNFLKTPDAQEALNTVGKLASTAVGIKAASGLLSSPVSSILTLGTVMAVWAKFNEYNNAPDRSQKITEIGEKVANIGQFITNMFGGGIQGLLGKFFGGGTPAGPTA